MQSALERFTRLTLALGLGGSALGFSGSARRFESRALGFLLRLPGFHLGDRGAWL